MLSRNQKVENPATGILYKEITTQMPFRHCIRVISTQTFPRMIRSFVTVQAATSTPRAALAHAPTDTSVGITSLSLSFT